MVGPRPADAAASLDEVVERVQATCAQTQDLSARFQQTATNRTLNSVQEASGVFLAKRPGKMRWEYQKPDARLFVTDGKTLWAYSPTEKQVVVQDVADALTSRLPLSFLAGNCVLAKDFDIGAGGACRHPRHAGHPDPGPQAQAARGRDRPHAAGSQPEGLHGREDDAVRRVRQYDGDRPDPPEAERSDSTTSSSGSPRRRASPW